MGGCARLLRQAATMRPMSHATTLLGLGLDAGGTETRWALAERDGRLRGSGRVAGMTALQLADAQGREAVAALLARIAADAAPAQAGGRVGALIAGLTGFDADQAPVFAQLAGAAFGVAPQAVQAVNDIELVCHNHFAPGEGYVVYAGTGSIAAFVDEQGALQRAGGRGAIIDDAGGGHWIAREALKRVWRAEDERPGAWRDSPLARELFARIGGSDWRATRAAVYGGTRGQVGELALAVAAAAKAVPPDAAALALLRQAGEELARLALALAGRYGARPVALAGRAFELHPAVEQALRERLPAGLHVRRLHDKAHETAARRAARALPSGSPNDTPR